MNDFTALTRAQWKGFWRDKQNLFWMMLFPLMFLFIFGTIFKDASASPSEIGVIGEVKLIDQLPPAAKKQFDDLFTTTKYADREAAVAAVRKGDLSGAVEQQGTQLVLHFSGADQVVAARVVGSFQGFIDGSNQAVSQVKPMFTLATERVEDDSLKPIQFIAPGLLGWAVAMGATFNTAMPFVLWRTSKLLRRLRLSPVRTGALVASRTVVCLAVALVQTAIFLGIGVGVFGLQLSGWWWLAIPLLLTATLAFMGIGMVAGAISKTAEGASGIANLIIMPMAFLSGSFIPLDGAPAWMTTLAKVLPLGQLNQGMLDVMVRDQGPAAIVVPMLTLLGFTVVFGVLAARMFRWED